MKNSNVDQFFCLVFWKIIGITADDADGRRLIALLAYILNGGLYPVVFTLITDYTICHIYYVEVYF